MIRSKPLPTRTYLRECFEYDPFTGIARWLERPVSHFSCPQVRNMWNNKYSYTQVGSKQKDNYIHIKINSSQYKLHRLIWMWWYGTEPLIIDHIDRNRTNNRITNLRSVTPLQNTHNSKIRSTNTSGYKGVEHHGYRWSAITYCDGKKIRLGSYDTPEEAALAIEEFKKI